MDNRAVWAAVVAADAAGLVVLRRAPAAAVRLLADPRTALAEGVDRPLVVLCGAALWVAAAWVALGLFAAVAACLPGSAGRWATTARAVLLPRVLQRLVAGSAGLGVLLAPVAAHATAGDPLPTPGWPVSTAAATPVPSWPVSPADPGSPGAPRRPTLHPLAPSTGGTLHPPAPSTGGTLHPPASPTGGTLHPPAPSTGGTLHPPASPTRPTLHPPAPLRASGAGAVTVRAGDSLWLIAARRLGAHPDASPDAQPDAHRVAEAWPRWYAANRDVIGDDPALITPGQVLHAPAAGAQEDLP